MLLFRLSKLTFISIKFRTICEYSFCLFACLFVWLLLFIFIFWVKKTMKLINNKVLTSMKQPTVIIYYSSNLYTNFFLLFFHFKHCTKIHNVLFYRNWFILVFSKKNFLYVCFSFLISNIANINLLVEIWRKWKRRSGSE